MAVMQFVLDIVLTGLAFFGRVLAEALEQIVVLWFAKYLCDRFGITAHVNRYVAATRTRLVVVWRKKKLRMRGWARVALCLWARLRKHRRATVLRQIRQRARSLVASGRPIL
jgi:hypothetical protein